ncbi:hypothetical protein Lbys_0856 [Leadbetterella byssophila DSM 17132]|uniref:Uncharacterized protein n=1 Tax=Leadbetterella byssophila (strain DSM 17132 / JCM 16389 / KACC 11308 / NBRC 106382 / 4M15) TaxID=649349 RepID=E4RR08_LEAB4|nr:hypothetical protein Lbys_0856 [Leadbetterella byssophila DSM 17132]
MVILHFNEIQFQAKMLVLITTLFRRSLMNPGRKSDDLVPFGLDTYSF